MAVPANLRRGTAHRIVCLSQSETSGSLHLVSIAPPYPEFLGGKVLGRRFAERVLCGQHPPIFRSATTLLRGLRLVVVKSNDDVAPLIPKSKKSNAR